MKHYLLLFIFLPFFCLAQRKDTVLKYLNEQLEFTTKEKAVFYGVAVKRDEGWFLFALYPDTTPLLKVNFKDRGLKTKQGPYVTFFPKNKIAYSGFYENNRKHGVWQSWYENGNLKDSGYFSHNLMTGKWKRWHENGKPASENNFATSISAEAMQSYRLTGMAPETGAREGIFVTWYSNGNKESEGIYRNNRMEGLWEWYHEDGKKSTLETYSEGLLTDLKCFDTTGNETGILCNISRPATLKGIGDYNSFLMENLSWPEAAIKNRIQGTVTVSFVVDKQGKLQNLQVLGYSNILTDAVKDFFRSLPDWEPAISHNRIVEWKGFMQIPFYLND